VQDNVESTTRQWFQKHMRFVQPNLHLVIQNELKPGAAELVGIYESHRTAPPATEASPVYVANDTSAAVGFAPLTETEHLVLAAEHYLNSASFKDAFPETGEDVKVMAVRRGRRLFLTVAIAFVDHHIWQTETYFHRKEAVRRSLEEFLTTKLDDLDRVEVHINMLDDESRGLEGMYLTVLGTSAESGDGGEVGRGNRVNGLISFCRPMTMEAAAGKNPVSHVGKIYNVLAHRVAARIYDSLDAIEEVYVWLCSQIGRPINQPAFASAQVALVKGASTADVERQIRDVVCSELADIESFTAKLARGEFRVC
jgi:S-adenosylmethionine synthetase